METPEHVERFRFVGGHVVVDFINARVAEWVESRGHIDCLYEYRDLLAWGHRAGVLTEDDADELLEEARDRPGEAERAFEHAMAVRGTIEDVFRTVAEGRDPAPESLRALERAHAEATARARLVPSEDGYQRRWDEPGDLSRPLWPVVDAALDLLTSTRLERVKVCRACPWMFFDASKNRSRRWCTMEDGCGQDAKTRRYVQRRAARRASRPSAG